MTTAELLLTAWHLHPSIVVGCVGLVALYGIGVAGAWPPRSAIFVLGVIVLFVALASPLHELGDHFLFSAHMLQHLLLLLVVPPLLLLGLPPALADRVLRWPPARRVERWLGRPLVAWLVGNGAMWLWHAPALYNAALDHETVHVVEHLGFLVSATIFWWPVLAPGRHARLHPLMAIVYLFTTMLASGALGIILTFAPPGLYPLYLQPQDHNGILRLVREGWGLTAAADQQLGGLLMWVPGSLVYLLAILGMLARWYALPADQPLPSPRRSTDVA